MLLMLNKISKAQQTQENCEYVKQNGHATIEEVRNHRDAGSDVKADDDLGFDPFHETQKALAELLEDELQVQQQKMFQQQQQQREREEQTRVQHQQTLASLNQQHFPQVNNLIKILKRIFLSFLINMINKIHLIKLVYTLVLYNLVLYTRCIHKLNGIYEDKLLF